MPIYEYECSSCREKFEQRRRIFDSDSEIRCPKCGAGDIYRVLSMFSTNYPGSSCAPDAPT